MRKFLASLLAVSMIASMSVLSSAIMYNDDEDGEEIDSGDYYASGNGSVSIDNVRPDTTYWLPITDFGDIVFDDPAYQVDATDVTTSVNELGDTDLFKWSFDKDGDGRSLIKSITVVNDKNLSTVNGNAPSSRTTYLKIVTNQTFEDDEKKATVEITIKPKKSDPDDYTYFSRDNSSLIGSGDVETSSEATLNLTLWITNYEISGEDADVETGDGFVFDPVDNEDNTIVYGDDRAAIYFAADDDADKFYAKLSTKSMSEIYTEYGDPVDADLWFYDFVGNKTIPSTSRATLTLGIPWDEDDDYVPDPTNVYIYELDTDGYLTDVTDQFTYSEDNDSTTGIEGWSIKTRTLGTYIVSDTELDLDVAYVEDDTTTSEEEASSDASSTSDGDKTIPNTGSSDMVNVAVAAAVVSLAAAGALAFKKASK